MKISVLIYEDKEQGGYTATVPAFPGCITEADTLEELKANVREAAELWLEGASARRDEDPPDQVIELEL
jgi:predicted RNase H-like HicB family nuclease